MENQPHSCHSTSPKQCEPLQAAEPLVQQLNCLSYCSGLKRWLGFLWMLESLVENTCLMALNSHSFGTTNLTYNRNSNNLQVPWRKEKKNGSNKSYSYFASSWAFQNKQSLYFWYYNPKVQEQCLQIKTYPDFIPQNPHHNHLPILMLLIYLRLTKGHFFKCFPTKFHIFLFSSTTYLSNLPQINNSYWFQIFCILQVSFVSQFIAVFTLCKRWF